MCPGIRPATGWIAYLTGTPLSSSRFGQVLDGVLGLGDRQAVAGHDDDLVGVGHLDRGVGGRGRLDHLVATSSPPPTAIPPPPNPPATIAGMERFIALAIRLVRIEPDAPTIMPATIIAVLFSANPLQPPTIRSSR